MFREKLLKSILLNTPKNRLQAHKCAVLPYPLDKSEGLAAARLFPVSVTQQRLPKIIAFHSGNAAHATENSVKARSRGC